MEQRRLDFDAPLSQLQAPGRRALTVTQLTQRIQELIELELVDVWVEGEISNLTIAASGHWYFSLKDEKAQIRAVVWKSAARHMRFRPRDGLMVVARGALRVYPPKGEYQIAVELLEPLGKGSLQEAFEQLKARLEKEGLFEQGRKRALPALPRRIGIVTSPTGAVIRDVLRVLSRRFSNIEALIYPARVQGNEAAGEIVQGLRVLGRIGGLDVIIVTRGGGSLEDLWPFNEEEVARALAACPVPTISAVGHETDFTIADFVADVRAPTPSAAAEMVVQAKADLRDRIQAFDARRDSALRLRMTRLRARVASLTAHRVFEAERGRIRNQAQRIDELGRRAGLALARLLERRRERWRRMLERLDLFRWERQIAARRDRLVQQTERLAMTTRSAIDKRRGALTRLAGMLSSLSPLSVLDRGYALVWNAARERLVRCPGEVEAGDALRIRVHGGDIRATVSDKEGA
ncbi:MAG: exodeoxyribonuclease VII large subunit [Vicinamibacteria bacterium]|nr:exodeoxyribonuclease VII large subunit [Vicinamibacteria bacterium]